MNLTRREMIALGLGAGVSACVPAGRPAGIPSAGESLDALAQRSGRRFGSAVGAGSPRQRGGALADPRYREILVREAGVLVPENELKWAWIRPSATSFDFGDFDPILAFAEQHDMGMRGHTLFWVPSQWYPRWLTEHDFGPQPARAAEAMLTEHVRTVARRYADRIYSYDVVNEAVQPETGQIRDTVVTRAMGGEAMLDLLFHTARAEAPNAELVYNDYMSWELTAEDPTHMQGVLRLLEGFRRRGTPVDTLGIQSHIRILKDLPIAQIVRESEGPWRRFLDEVVAMGYRLVITEFDVNDKRAPDDIVVRDRMVADYARAYLDQMLSYEQLGDVLAWGMVDRYSWLTGFDPRPDRSIKRGTPYDSDYRPKPLRDAIADSFRAASSHFRPISRG